MVVTGRHGSTLLRLCAAAFLADMALYLTLTGVPYTAMALGAGTFTLGMLPGVRGLAYAASTVWAGQRTETGERLRWARWTLAAVSLSVLSLIWADHVWWVGAVMAMVGLALAFFWPALQAQLADLAAGGEITGNLGWFNVSWSTGKAAGFLLGGALLVSHGSAALFAVAVAGFVAVQFLLWRRSPGAGKAVGTVEHPSPPAPPHAARFRRAAWLANALAFGVSAVLNLQYPEYLAHLGLNEMVFGVYLGLIFGAQTAVFVLLSRFRGWRYRAWPLVAAQLALAAVLFGLPWLTGAKAIWLTAPVVGAALGTTYFASLFYSVEAPAGRGRNAGIHEAMLGAGALLVPLLGGLATLLGGGLAAPYVCAGALTLIALARQGPWLIGQSRPQRRK